MLLKEQSLFKQEDVFPNPATSNVTGNKESRSVTSHQQRKQSDWQELIGIRSGIPIERFSMKEEPG
jgi:hypothetical protein